MKNVFIEGIQGMGKSTLLNKLQDVLPEYKVCREGDYSPVELAWNAWMSKEEYEETLKRYQPIKDEIIKYTHQEGEHFVVSYTRIITDIPEFHKNLEEYEMYNGRKSLQEMKDIILSRYKKFSGTGYLFECSFFQNIIEDLMLFYILSDDEIVDFYKALFSFVDKDDFLLLYLNSDNLEENIKIIKKERSDDLGNELWYQMMLEYFVKSPYGEKNGCSSFEDMINHFKHRQKLELRIIREVLGDNAVVLPAKEWEIEEVMAFIN